MKIIATIIGAIVLFIALVVAIGLLLSWPVMLLWNGCVVGLIAGVTPITSIWHAWGLLILCGLLFKSSSSTTVKKD